MTPKSSSRRPPSGASIPERSSALPSGPRAFVEALARAGVRLRVSHEQPDGMTPIYVAAPIAVVRRFVPEGGVIEGTTVRSYEDWVIAFCGSEYA